MVEHCGGDEKPTALSSAFQNLPNPPFELLYRAPQVSSFVSPSLKVASCNQDLQRQAGSSPERKGTRHFFNCQRARAPWLGSPGACKCGCSAASMARLRPKSQIFTEQSCRRACLIWAFRCPLYCVGSMTSCQKCSKMHR